MTPEQEIQAHLPGLGYCIVEVAWDHLTKADVCRRFVRSAGDPPKVVEYERVGEDEWIICA